MLNFFRKLKYGTVDIPEFDASEVKRYHLLFKGRVQGVGFRYSFQDIGNKLKLTGWVKNLSNGDVEAEIQGEEDKINFLTNVLQNKPPIEIEHLEKKEVSLVNGESEVEAKW